MIREISRRVELSSNSFWDREEIVCEIEKSKKTFIRFSLCSKDNKEFISIREFTFNREGEEIPTKKGMTIGKEHLDEFIKCLGMF